jgi:hypothetical protein
MQASLCLDVLLCVQGKGWKDIADLQIWPFPTAEDVKAKFKLPNCGLTGDACGLHAAWK